jgi:glycosyltransferase involved in cell wall biosynthesis
MVIKPIIQIYPVGENLHTAYQSLVNYPPEGYSFVRPIKSKNYLFKLKKYNYIRRLYKLYIKIFKTTNFLEFAYKEDISDNVNLVYSLGGLYKGNKKFIVDLVDSPYSLSGYDYNLFIRNKKEIENYLMKNNCKAIICPHKTSLDFMKREFDKKIIKKFFLVKQATPIEENLIKKDRKDTKINILFVGSITNPNDFYIKGGLETIKSFLKISEEYDVTLTIRCKIPLEIKKYLLGNKKILVLEEEMPRADIINLYKKADMLLLPGHHYHLMVTLEAMSYQLPVVALNTYAFKDYIKDGYNGFLISPSNNFNFYKHESYPTNLRNHQFVSEISNVDERVINEICEKIKILIKDKKLRLKMGLNARKIIIKNFTIKKRNSALKRIFYKSLNS